MKIMVVLQLRYSCRWLTRRKLSSRLAWSQTNVNYAYSHRLECKYNIASYVTFAIACHQHTLLLRMCFIVCRGRWTLNGPVGAPCELGANFTQLHLRRVEMVPGPTVHRSGSVWRGKNYTTVLTYKPSITIKKRCTSSSFATSDKLPCDMKRAM